MSTWRALFNGPLDCTIAGQESDCCTCATRYGRSVREVGLQSRSVAPLKIGPSRAGAKAGFLTRWEVHGVAAPSLRGCTILVVEDEPLVAAGVTDALRSAGASVRVAHRTTD